MGVNEDNETVTVTVTIISFMSGRLYACKSECKTLNWKFNPISGTCLFNTLNW